MRKFKLDPDELAVTSFLPGTRNTDTWGGAVMDTEAENETDQCTVECGGGVNSWFFVARAVGDLY